VPADIEQQLFNPDSYDNVGRFMSNSSFEADKCEFVSNGAVAPKVRSLPLLSNVFFRLLLTMGTAGWSLSMPRASSP